MSEPAKTPGFPLVSPWFPFRFPLASLWLPFAFPVASGKPGFHLNHTDKEHPGSLTPRDAPDAWSGIACPPPAAESPGVAAIDRDLLFRGKRTKLFKIRVCIFLRLGTFVFGEF